MSPAQKNGMAADEVMVAYRGYAGAVTLDDGTTLPRNVARRLPADVYARNAAMLTANGHVLELVADDEEGAEPAEPELTPVVISTPSGVEPATSQPIPAAPSEEGAA